MTLKVMTIAGTRPELIRLSLLLELLDGACDHTFVHSGQNDDPNLREVFHRQLNIREPDISLQRREGPWASRLGGYLSEIGAVLESQRPDRLVILGDTDSALAAIVAARFGIAVFHLEAGNRCFDTRVPEETNRRLVDHSSDVLMPYTERSRANLLREGFASDRVFVVGNPIGEVLHRNGEAISSSTVLSSLGLASDRYILVTMHRAENVDDSVVLQGLIDAVGQVCDDLELPAIFSVHPRTAAAIRSGGVTIRDRIRLIDPVGFHEFVSLEKNARLVLSDSGTVQEECAILHVPSVVLRTSTERPETLECGSSTLGGVDAESVVRAARVAVRSSRSWPIPDGYETRPVAETAAKLILAK